MWLLLHKLIYHYLVRSSVSCINISYYEQSRIISLYYISSIYSHTSVHGNNNNNNCMIIIIIIIIILSIGSWIHCLFGYNGRD